MEKGIVKIERGVPLVKNTRRLRSQWAFILNMKKGESFTMAAPVKRNAIYRFAARHSIKITQRKDPSGGLRFWKL